VLLALCVIGVGYAALAPSPQRADAAPDDAARLALGAQLYSANCMSCHGANLQGVPDRAPSLIGVGQASVYFQVSSGRMPLADERSQALRKPPGPEFDPSSARGRANLDALGAYIEAHGGGPSLPDKHGDELIGDDPARGGELFRLNCASCHSFTGRGGMLTEGKYAPVLNPASPDQIYAAMLTGPADMPRFGDRQLTTEEKKDIIGYLVQVRGQRNSVGGFSLGEVGPFAEGMVAILVGLVALVALTVWLGARS
jgi:ubiquinol-cytochrome c reductase cytochrome c subunit